MKWILLLMLLTEIFSSTPIKPKICCDCKFFKPNYFTGNKYGKCSLFKKDQEEDDNRYYLVDGIKRNSNNDYFFCSTARSQTNMCGPEATLYVKKS